jgi:hypothetical protein
LLKDADAVDEKVVILKEKFNEYDYKKDPADIEAQLARSVPIAFSLATRTSS